MKRLNCAAAEFVFASFVLFAALAARGEAQAPAAPAAASQAPVAVDEADATILSGFLRHAREVPAGFSQRHFKAQAMPEMFCWVELRQMDTALTAYELTRDPACLETFIVAFETMRSVLQRGEDGYLGWYGVAIKDNADPDNPEAVIDEIQTSFRAVGVVARFLTLLADEPDVAAAHPGLRERYLNLLENHLVAKWDARGHFVDLGERGAIYRWNFKYKPQRAGQTLPFEKQAILVEGLLNLYRATGKDAYLRRAALLGLRFKRVLNLIDGHYAWNYWEPAGSWDLDPVDPAKWRHWVGREPRGAWYDASLSVAVQLYHYGLVFDAEDMKRFRKTQMDVCWNGSLESPAFSNVDGKPVKGAFVCPMLACFEPRLAELLYTGGFQAERVAKASNPWHGGLTGGQWLQGKYLTLPRAAGGKPLYAELTRNFRENPENAEFLARVNRPVTGRGHVTPLTPAQADFLKTPAAE